MTPSAEPTPASWATLASAAPVVKGRPYTEMGFDTAGGEDLDGDCIDDLLIGTDDGG